MFGLIQELGSVGDADMFRTFNMGCGFCCVVPAERSDDAQALLASRHPGAARVGTVTSEAGRVSLPHVGVVGTAEGLAGT